MGDYRYGPEEPAYASYLDIDDLGCYITSSYEHTTGELVEGYLLGIRMEIEDDKVSLEFKMDLAYSQGVIEWVKVNLDDRFIVYKRGRK